MKIRFIEDGNFARWVRTGLLVVGILIMFVAYKYVPPAPYGGFLLLLGLGVAALAGYASRAHMLKIKPFDNSCKKARKSYEVKDGDKEQ
ncbi:hypothetical protein [Caballeronia ptereochthonis]|uniref:DUF202 domain-containing protein n=1 Tax=Caballeronia ptereochthonis TaxID=1777144 RepID=A0A158EBG3_9BURK|nr:hypothetical protein [Caballeronia ptereochthonis]SAL04222.1 hypothetical protein AWB83_06988 [Caballeronia ptereochthonis]